MRNSKVTVGLAALVAGIILAWSSPAACALEIRIHEQAEVTGSLITLGEVASFSGQSDAQLAELKQIVVAHAPAAGGRLVLDRKFLSYKLKARLSRPHLSVVLPRQLVVTRRAQTVGKSTLVRIFREHVKAHMPWPPATVRFSNIRVPEAVLLPVGRFSYKVQTLGKSRYLGTVTLLATLFVDDVRQRAVRLSGRVEVRQQVVVAARDLRRRQKIQRGDLCSKTVDLARMPGGVLTDVSDAIGMQTVQPLRAGEVVLSRMLQRAPLIKRGDRLVIVAESACLKVVTTGRALEDGYEGSAIRVANLSSGKEIIGRVLGPSSVRVDF
ncbi:MAG: flagellar basal body P-ring formation protein FlgA [Deltaproteobacteria bacterium]|nr:flagellar basal body P-ring formation protein FlgA [Deltaproteobacteria bacterium]MBW2069703.1 flagellar basal body P-ring formation protein FlgA [Deltaproteobacteria bacterium]